MIGIRGYLDIHYEAMQSAIRMIHDKLKLEPLEEYYLFCEDSFWIDFERVGNV